MRTRTFQSSASFSFVSSFFLSSASTLGGTSASWLSVASDSGAGSLSSFLVVASAWSLYHLVLADNGVLNGFKGAGENCDRTDGWCAIVFELEEMALEDAINARRNMVMAMGVGMHNGQVSDGELKIGIACTRNQCEQAPSYNLLPWLCQGRARIIF